MLDNVPRKSADTRERLLELAENAVLAKGFAATSIDELIAAAGISKSGFFYHFKDKGELAKGLLVRYLEQDRQLLEDIFRRGDDLNEDPLHGFLVGLKLFAEMLADLPQVHPGCLAASFAYQDQLFNDEVRKAERRRHAGLANPVSRAPAHHRRALSAAARGRSRCLGRHGQHAC
jgi:TetR/AcrR family transcriptional regulator, transcriptional repressor for nem operon